MKKAILLPLAALFFSGLLLVLQKRPPDFPSGAFRYVMTNAETPTSFDPLDADHSNNISMARMVYLTPLEPSAHNSLSSHILTEFSYNSSIRTISWMVKDGLFFSDHSPITVEDVAFAVVRMAYTRPKFPVLKHIAGLAEWREGKNPLQSTPKGIRVEGNKIEITFEKDVPNPLYRFCLELFSIIPKRCVDAKGNKIICDPIPTSGQYFISQKNEKEWTFVKNRNLNFKGPYQIVFDYWGNSNILERLNSIDQNTVVYSDDGTISLDEQKNLPKDFKMRVRSASRFVGLLMNPKAPSFKRPECRRAFGNLAVLAYAKTNDTAPQASLFARVIPGYLTPEQLRQRSKFAVLKDMERCRDDLKKTPLRWGVIKDIGHRKNREGVTQEIFRSLGVSVPRPLMLESYPQFYRAFVEGELDFITFGSGFWALDVAGDLQMLFTPNLHKALEFVAGDLRLQELIEEAAQNPKDDKAFAQVNQYLYDHALIRPYSHFKRFYLARNPNLLNNIPIGITFPAPWQLFR